MPAFEKQCPVCNVLFSTRWEKQNCCSRSCARKLDAIRNGGHSHTWKGGRWKVNTGYWKIKKDGHPRADKNGYVLEHIVVMEEKIGRYLSPTEHVHHKNGKRDDNDPENLELWHKKDPFGIRVADYHCAGCTCEK